MVYRNHLVNRNSLEYQRYEYIKKILAFIVKDEPYIFFDECAMHGFLTKRKSWSYSDEPILAPINSGYRLKQSIYGSLSNKFDRPHLWYAYRSTNGEDCLEYFKLLLEECRKVTDQKFHLIMDGHKAHYSVKHGSKEFLNQNFIVHQMPSGSPQINAIEHLWSSFKRRFKKALMLNPERKMTQNDFDTRL